MWSQRRKYGLYLAGVSAVGFLLSLGLKTTPGIALLAGGVPAYAALSLSHRS